MKLFKSILTAIWMLITFPLNFSLILLAQYNSELIKFPQTNINPQLYVRFFDKWQWFLLRVVNNVALCPDISTKKFDHKSGSLKVIIMNRLMLEQYSPFTQRFITAYAVYTTIEHDQVIKNMNKCVLRAFYASTLSSEDPPFNFQINNLNLVVSGIIQDLEDIDRRFFKCVTKETCEIAGILKTKLLLSVLKTGDIPTDL